jgi:alpha-D-xyloside xylohydrolase
MRSHAERVVAAFALALGCGGGAAAGPDTTTGTGDTTATSVDSSTGDDTPAIFRLELDDATGVVSLLRDDEVLLTLPADAFVLGQVDAIDDDASYDPAHPLAVDFVPPSAVTRGEGGLLTVALAYPDGTTASVRFDEAAPGRFSAVLVRDAGGPPTAVFRIRVRCDAQDRFYGMGETFDAVEHRGTARPMQLEADLQFEGGSNEAHVPVPLVIGTRGWGVFVQDDHPGLFELATDEDDLVQITYGMGPHADAGLRFHLYGAEHPLDITAHYWATTGAPAIPAPWALGPWLWRNENTDAAQVIADAETLRDLDLPHSALWIDRPYATGVNTFDFEPTRFADPAGMIDALHDLGLRVALWHSPYVSTMDEPATELAAEAEANGYYPEPYGLLLNAWSAPPIDLTNPDARDWWSALLSGYAALGIEGYKLDYGEDVVTGLGAVRVPWGFADGSDERTMHGRYHTAYHAPYVDALPADGGFILARAGTWGEQTQASVIWPGDLDADLSRFGEPRDGSLGVGGLPSALHGGLSLSPSGFPLFASDTGGYRDSPPTKEVFTRWFEHSALMPVMQIGTGSSTVAWEFAGTDFDDEMLGWYRDYTRLHLRLFPLFWTAIQRFADGGRPIVRPLGLAHPELGVHPSDVYMLGDDLLVAPVVDAGVVQRTITLPDGAWVHWFDGAVYQGGDVVIDAPLGKLPLLLRAGGIVPMLRPTIDTLSPTGQPDRVDSFANDAGKLWPRIALGPASSITLYDGTSITQRDDVDDATLTWTDGEVFTQGAVIEVVAIADAPVEVTLDGAPLAPAADMSALEQAPGWLHTGTTLWIGVGTGQHTIVVRR